MPFFLNTVWTWELQNSFPKSMHIFLGALSSKNFLKPTAVATPVLFLMGVALAYLLSVSTAVRIYLCPLLNFSRGMMEMRSTDHCSSRPCTKILSCWNLRLALLNFVYGSCVFSQTTVSFSAAPTALANCLGFPVYPVIRVSGSYIAPSFQVSWNPSNYSWFRAFKRTKY